MKLKLAFIAFNCLKCGRAISLVEIAANTDGVLGVRVACPDCEVAYDRIITLDDILEVVRATPQPQNTAEPKWARRFL